MIVKDFVQLLRKDGEVEFDSRAVVEAHRGFLALTFADSLSQLLSPDALIHAAWQTDAFGEDWQGCHRWWVLLDGDLLELEARMLRQEGRHSPVVAHRFIDLRAVRGLEIDMTYRDTVGARGAEVSLYATKVAAALPDGRSLSVIGERQLADAARRFGTELRAAVARARLTGPPQRS